MTLQEIICQLTPPAIPNGTRRLKEALQRYGLFGATNSKAAELRRIHELKLEFTRNNSGCEADEMVLRPGLLTKIHPNSRPAFEAFCFLNPKMVEELDSFRRLTAGCSHLLDIGALHGIFL